ncbi:hypothetical protein C3L33_06441, partial [Rhododendron williamsianum]
MEDSGSEEDQLANQTTEDTESAAKRLKTSDGTHIPYESASTTPCGCDAVAENSLSAMERILGYNFRNKDLLQEALTHSSWPYSRSYERLEFVGDAIICVTFSMFVYHTYPDLEPGQLSRIRAANISTEKLARLAVRHGFHQYIRINAPAVEAKIEEFALKVRHDDAVTYGDRLKAPKLLADLVESIAAAIFVDCGCDLKEFWLIFRSILEPIAMLEDLKQQPQPVSVLYELCQKQGKQVEIKYRKNDSENTACVFVDGEFVACGYSCQKDSAKIDAAKQAVSKLTETANGKEMMKGIIASTYSSQKDLPRNDVKEAINKMSETVDDKSLLNRIPLVLNQVGEIEVAKQKLNQFCEKKQLAKPTYRVEKESGPAHEKRFICSVQIEIGSEPYTVSGKDKPRVKEAENSAASTMLQILRRHLI